MQRCFGVFEIPSILSLCRIDLVNRQRHKSEVEQWERAEASLGEVLPLA